MLELGFMQRALAAAVLLGAVCGALGFFVVLRRLAFVGVGISHSAIGGIAIGLLAGWNPLATAGAFALLVAFAIALGRRRARLSEDTLIGVVLAGSLALAVVLASLRHGYQQDLFGYLFGNLLAVSPGETWALAGISLVVAAALALAFHPLLRVAFDEELARAYGQRVDAWNAGLLALLALTVVIGVRLVGALLVEALLVVPAATASLLASNWRGQIALAAGLGAACGAVGLAAAWHFDVAAGGAIVLLAVAIFGAVLLLRRRA